MNPPGPPPMKPPMAPKPRKAKFVRANFAYAAKEVDELSFEEGDLLYILDWTTDPEWWKARCRGKEGLVPANFLNKSKGDDDEPNPFHDACKRGNIELLEDCLLNKIPVNQVDKSGNTGLQWACRGGHSHIVARLLSLKPQVDLNEKNRLGDNALHLASSKGSKECIVLLRNTGKMDVFEVNSEGMSPYELAKEPEAKEVLKNWMKEFQGNQPQDYEYEQSDDEEDDEN